MRQLKLFSETPAKREHGGVLSVGKRRCRRPLSTRESLHLTLRTEYAKGPRSLLKHRDIIGRVIKKGERLFRVKVYRYAIAGNHIHLLLRGKSRTELQNFFRVLAGHTAQEILRRCPLSPAEQSTIESKGCRKNKRKFWAVLTYTRIVTWGREFRAVALYILQNTLEVLHLIAYQPRRPRPCRAYNRDCS